MGSEGAAAARAAAEDAADTLDAVVVLEGVDSMRSEAEREGAAAAAAAGEGEHIDRRPTEEANPFGKSPLIKGSAGGGIGGGGGGAGGGGGGLPPVLELASESRHSDSPTSELSEQIDDGRRAHLRGASEGRSDASTTSMPRSHEEASEGPSSPSVDRGSDENGSDEGGADGADGDASAAKRRRLTRTSRTPNPLAL